MRQTVKATYQTGYDAKTPASRVTEPVRQIDTKKRRQQRVADLLDIANAVHGEALARFAHFTLR